jgi:hypothetical protein
MKAVRVIGFTVCVLAILIAALIFGSGCTRYPYGRNYANGNPQCGAAKYYKISYWNIWYFKIPVVSLYCQGAEQLPKRRTRVFVLSLDNFSPLILYVMKQQIIDAANSYNGYDVPFLIGVTIGSLVLLGIVAYVYINARSEYRKLLRGQK